MKVERSSKLGMESPKIWKVFSTLLERDLLAKRRNKMNIYISFVIPPLLGLIIGFILKYSKGQDYTLYDNKHLPTFFFLSAVVVLFLALTNSIEEVVKERTILKRETRIYNNAFLYYFSKFTTLLVFCIIQNAIFLAVSYLVLQIRELFLSHLFILTLLSVTGIAMGLLASSIPRISSKAANNLIPLILIPQIILGGALVEYKDMNQSLAIDQGNPIPEICQIIPSRWGFEALIVNQAQNNRFHSLHNQMRDSLSSYQKILPRQNLVASLRTERQISLANADSLATAIENDLRNRMEKHLEQFKSTHGNLMVESTTKSGQTHKESDGSSQGHLLISPLFSPTKRIPFTSLEISTLLFNTLVLLVMSMLVMLCTILILKRTVFDS